MRKLAVAALLSAAAPALAESPRVGSFQLQMGGYRPNIDAEFAGAAYPYRDIFGTGRNWAYKAQGARSLYAGFGTLDLGFGIGWFQKTGRGFIEGTTTPSGDDTSLRILPLSLSLTYRLDAFADWFPFAPYLRASLERWQWWVTSGGGGAAQVPGGPSGQGATNGWSAALGICFLLDFLDPQLAREMDRDVGINDTYLFLEASRIRVDDFGSKKSWDLSPSDDLVLGFGILFVF